MVITNDRCVSKHEKKSNNFVLNKTRRRHQGKIKVYAVCPQIGHGRNPCLLNTSTFAYGFSCKKLFVKCFQLRRNNLTTRQLKKLQGKRDIESKIEMAMPAKRRQRMQLGPPAARYSLVFYAIYILLCMHLVWGNLGSLSES
ncbi:hypothetical protein AB4K20DRAFT_1864799 [Rhizopus microsporus]